ncbi:MAG: EAL domain-containing protein [Gammaproteobacteria bacterium]
MADDTHPDRDDAGRGRFSHQAPSVGLDDVQRAERLGSINAVLCRRAPADLAFGLAAAAVVTAVFWGVAPLAVVLGWMGLQVGVGGARLAQWAIERRTGDVAAGDGAARLARHQAGVVMYGVVWGTGALLPALSAFSDYTPVLLVATAAVAVSAYAAAANVRRVTLGFAIPALVPVTGVLAWGAGPLDLALGGLVWLLIVRLAFSNRSADTLHLPDEPLGSTGPVVQQLRHDPLTGLMNRPEFEDRIAQALESARTEGCGHALCYLDLDRFEIVNDTCGHTAGDALLKELAVRLRARLRKGDTLARLGGDEFGVLLDGCPPEHAKRVAELLRKVVDGFRFKWQDKTFHLGVSIGLVPIDGQSGGLSAVLSAADSACYVAKEQGRNRIHVFQLDDKAVAERHGQMQWLQRIQEALDNDRFELYFQPIVQLRKGGHAGVHGEVLLRMLTPDGETVPPGAFLPTAERYHLMPAVDRWVVSHAFAALAHHRGTGTDVATCSINLSGQSLSEPAFLDFIIGQLEQHQTRSTQICFEITETAVIANLTNATRFMTVLRNMGCRFALDDFGSGLSSFAYLKNLSVDYLKLDGSFVRNMVRDNIDRAMVKAINQLGHVMSIETIAEFVENDATLKAARVLGIDHAQGYGVGMPEPMNAALPRLAKAAGLTTGTAWISNPAVAMPGRSRS